MIGEKERGGEKVKKGGESVRGAVQEGGGYVVELQVSRGNYVGGCVIR